MTAPAACSSPAVTSAATYAVVSEANLTHARAALAAAEETGSLVEIGPPLFSFGFAYLWHGDLAEAEARLQEALAMAERTGDVSQQMFCLTYLAVTHRKRGGTEATRQYALRAQDAASGQPHALLGMAEANLAWVAWREQRLEEARSKAQNALDLWQSSPVPFPFHWAGLWPAIGVAVADDRIGEAIEHMRGLLAPTQQPPPESLAALVEQAIRAWDEGRPEIARTHLEQAIPQARELGYL
jgi:tetratricopeptide (TPR) repeat protein